MGCTRVDWTRDQSPSKERIIYKNSGAVQGPRFFPSSIPSRSFHPWYKRKDPEFDFITLLFFHKARSSSLGSSGTHDYRQCGIIQISDQLKSWGRGETLPPTILTLNQFGSSLGFLGNKESYECIFVEKKERWWFWLYGWILVRISVKFDINA